MVVYLVCAQEERERLEEAVLKVVVMIVRGRKREDVHESESCCMA